MTNREPGFMTWKRRGAERVRRLVEGMSREEELEFWRKRTEEMRTRRKAKLAELPQSDTREGPRSSDSDNVIREPECVAIKRRGAERVRRLVKGMSREEELEFWRKRTEDMRARPKVRQSQSEQTTAANLMT